MDALATTAANYKGSRTHQSGGDVLPEKWGRGEESHLHPRADDTGDVRETEREKLLRRAAAVDNGYRTSVRDRGKVSVGER